MSLTDKVIKNTFYHTLSQVTGLLFPLILTPIIISNIGEFEFGIYAIALGFIGTFGLFDLSISSSFIKFISEHYNKAEIRELNNTITTGFAFYVVFSFLICLAGFLLSDFLISIINVPPELADKGVFAIRISLLIFFIANTTTIFVSILISLQKMYINSWLGIIVNFLNAISIYTLLQLGFGLKGLLYSQLATVAINGFLSFYIAKREMPEMKFGIKNLNIASLKKMSIFGAQMQTSKLATFASEKYDEFLLAYFSVLSNVTYFNLGGRISRLGRFLPFQLIPQVAPVAAELNAKGEKEKINRLFEDTTKYLTVISVPVLFFIFVFADTILFTWMGSDDYSISAYILKILIAGQFVNLLFSAPGNSITPNLGYPKYQMREGLISLIINLILSYMLIKNYGIVGAAAGNTAAIIISSLYIFYVSARFFERKISSLIADNYLKPIAAGFAGIIISLIMNWLINNFIFSVINRATGLANLVINGFIFVSIYSLWLLNFNYINERDKEVLAKIILKIIPINFFLKRKKVCDEKKEYNNELVSIFVVTHNRLEFLKKCLNNLLPTLKDIRYELIVWDNNSTDGTVEYLQQFKEKNGIRVVLNSKNIGTNAKGKSAELTKGQFIIGLDDDVIEFPENWIQKMIAAYKSIPDMGYLSADVIQNEMTDGAKQPDEYYREVKFDKGNLTLLVGPAGGWCFMLSREVYEKVGKFYQSKKRIFFMEDMDYTNRIIDKGMKVGILKGLKVYHATGILQNEAYKEVYERKMKDFEKGTPLYYRIKMKLRRIFSAGRYISKLIELAEKETN
jgi:O-antigen/teichoic acid export membrane protein/GT2 family glycosyltransferase